VLPSISVVIPTLNSERTLARCLTAIRSQDYPQELVEIVIADASSEDRSREIGEHFGAIIVGNELVTGEAGKAAAVKRATGELVALIDSDNILMGDDWFRRMIEPFADPAVVGSEPLAFVADATDSIVDRYCAILGANDPLCLFIGNYDRMSSITGRWTDLPVCIRDEGTYFTFSLSETAPLPTIGANGTMYRRATILGLVGDYLNDIDLPMLLAERDRGLRFAKVRVGIRHLFCADSRSFVRKQGRRIRDYFTRQTSRTYPWKQLISRGVVRFVCATVLIVPLLYQSTKGYLRSRDAAAFYHPIACWLTLCTYGINGVFMRGRALSRVGWRQ
jgi:glycosyltransferase involved in cell wall biosynthesis